MKEVNYTHVDRFSRNQRAQNLVLGKYVTF